jgi:ABC-type multidrug transport system fused ATPase/permease subunit
MQNVKKEKKERENISAIRKLLKYYSPKKRLLYFAIVFGIMWGLVQSTTPYITGLAFDEIFENLEGGVFGNPEVQKFILILIFVAIFGFLVQGLAIFCEGLLHQGIQKKLRRDVFSSLQKQTHKYFVENSSGELISRSTSDIYMLSDFFYEIPLFTTLGTVNFIVIISLLFNINFVIGIICLISLPIMWFTTTHFKIKFWPFIHEARKIFGEITKVMQENIAGAIVSRVFDSKDKDLDRLDKINSRYRDTLLRSYKFMAAVGPQLRIIVGLLVSIVLLYGGFLVMNNEISVGLLIASILLAGRLGMPIDIVTRLGVVLGRTEAIGKRVLEIIESTPVIMDNLEAKNLPVAGKGEITFEDVSFGYRHEPVLEEISFLIPAGSNLALLGGTGSGKSSLINLIPRFYDVQCGTVKIDGIDVRDLKLESIRKRIGFCDQETFLFSKTIRENIAFGKPQASKEEIVQVAKISQIHEFVINLPDGYETIIGERGVTLSGGQRQRLSIARSLLADPLIVVFDDSLSSVDVRTEIKIQEALEALLKNRTTIFITQRLSTIKYADAIVIMDKGRIAEYGTHAELLSKNGIYKHLFESQVDGIVDLEVIKELGEE